VKPKLNVDGDIIRSGYTYQMSPNHWATTTARTEVMTAYNAGRLEGFKLSGVVEQVEYSVSPDERLCAICEPFDARVFKLEDSDGIIPQHPNCRCQWIPLLGKKDFKEAKSEAIQNVSDAYSVSLPETPLEISLRTDDLPNITELGGGINETFIVSNGKKGVFKPKAGESSARSTVPVGTYYKREVAAFKIDKIYGFDLVPTTVVKNVKGQVGSLQHFQVGYKTGYEASGQWVDAIARSERQKMSLFDYLIANEDRHRNNWMVNKTGKVAAIDNGLSLGKGGVNCYRNFFENALYADIREMPAIKEVLKRFTPESIDLLKVELLDKGLLEKEAFKSLLSRINNMVNDAGDWYNRWSAQQMSNLSGYYSTSSVEEVMEIAKQALIKLQGEL